MNQGGFLEPKSLEQTEPFNGKSPTEKKKSLFNSIHQVAYSRNTLTHNSSTNQQTLPGQASSEVNNTNIYLYNILKNHEPKKIIRK
jgi:hypothetical protein